MSTYQPLLHTPASQPEPEPIWPSDPPGGRPVDGVEAAENRPVDQDEYGLNRSVSNVNTPTITVHLPHPDLATGAAVLILPGGGFRRIVYDKEGHAVARWLTQIGIAGVVLKYRTRDRDSVEPLLDAQRATRILRSRSPEWGLDPERLGVIGFSAGGHIAARLAAEGDDGRPDAPDPIDGFNSRPSFLSFVYPAVPADIEERIAASTGPAFIVHAADDGLSVDDHSLRLYRALRRHGVSVEMHVYASGGHAFGLGVRGGPIACWPAVYARWLQSHQE